MVIHIMFNLKHLHMDQWKSMAPIFILDSM